jgi:hypothetical protein
VADFTITASPSSLNIVQGSAASSTITVLSVGGFSGTVSLTYSASSGLTVKLAPSSVVISGSATLTVNSTTTTPTGTYLVNVTGTSGSLVHTVTVTVTVTSSVVTAKAPYFLVLWSQRVSVSKKTGTGTESWLYIALNGNKGTTLYAAVRITVTQENGVSSFVLTSPVFTLKPYSIALGTLSQTFTSANLGETFHFTAVILWGTTATTNPAALPYTGTYSISGSFTITSQTSGH